MLKGIIGFEKDKIVQSGKLIVPCLVYLVYLYFENSVMHKSVLPTFGVASVVAFAIMISFGYIYGDLNMPMIDGAILVKLENRKLFYIAKVIIIAGVSAMFSVGTIAYEILANFVNGMSLFDRSLTINDLISAFLLLCICAFCGGMAGLLCNERIFGQREVRVMSAILFGLLSVAKMLLVASYAPLKYIAWILPMIMDLNVKYSRSDEVNWGNISGGMLAVAIYAILISILYVFLMNKKGLEK